MCSPARRLEVAGRGRQGKLKRHRRDFPQPTALHRRRPRLPQVDANHEEVEAREQDLVQLTRETQANGHTGHDGSHHERRPTPVMRSEPARKHQEASTDPMFNFGGNLRLR